MTPEALASIRILVVSDRRDPWDNSCRRWRGKSHARYWWTLGFVLGFKTSAAYRRASAYARRSRWFRRGWREGRATVEAARALMA